MVFCMAENIILGYGRVSSKDQNPDRQIESLKRYVPNERDIYIDKKSGKDFAREEYKKMKDRLRAGDTVYIHEFDRLGRNKEQIIAELKDFKERGVTVRILNVPSTLSDFSALGNDDLQRSLIIAMNNMLIEVLAIMAENERKTILRRQREGLEAAKKKGVKLGRPAIKKPLTWDEDIKAWEAGEVTAVSLYRDKYKMSKAVFYKLVKDNK